MRHLPYSATALTIGGAILMVLGLYFAFLRPPLLPEDARFMGTSLAQVQATLPGLSGWLRHVFRNGTCDVPVCKPFARRFVR